MTPLNHALQPAGPQAAQIADLWWLTLAILAAVFAAVLAALLYALWRAPRSDQKTHPDLSSLHQPEPRARLAVTSAVVLSAVLLVVLVVASAMTDRALARLPLHGAVNIHVTANQWWWHVRYDDAEPSRVFSTANEIYVPVGRPVVVKLTSNDVIHSFWVPNLHGKKDLIPGTEARLQFRADEPGVYRGQCAEYCGLQHAFMAFLVTAVAPAEFERWAESQRQPAREPGDELQRRGKELFVSGTCMMCHAIQGTTAGGRKAPDLTHLASRPTLAAGRLANTPQNLAAWIADPQKHKPGANMPGHALAEADMKAMVAYLSSLK